MEDFWRLAPQPALRVWRRAAGLPDCEANAAALAWAAAQGLTPQWQDLARDCLAGPGPWPLGEAGPALDGTLITVDDGALLWWSAAPTAALETALKLAGVTVWQIDAAGEWISFEPQGARPISVPAGVHRLPVAAVREGIHPEDREAVLQSAKDAAASDQPIDVVARYRQLDGSWRPLLTRRVALRDGQGRSLGLLGISLDISLLVRERDDMLRLRERIGTVANAVGLGLWSREGADDRVDWNGAMYRLHERDPAEGPPGFEEYLARHVHEPDVERLRRGRDDAERAWPAIEQTEFRIRKADGGLRWIYSWTRHELHEGRRVAFGLHLDVSERRDAEFELQQEREQTLLTLSLAGVGVWRRTDATHAYWSPAMYRLRGLDPADPRPLHELNRLCLHPDDRIRVEALIAQSRQDDQPYEWEFRVIWPDGSQRWLVTRGRAAHDDEGRLLYMAGVNVDVTARHHAQALAQESLRLDQLKRTQSEFLARVSHELRTPMNAVLGFAQLLSFDKREPLTARQAERIGRIEAAGRHLLALIDDVLDLARIDVDQLPLADEPVTLDELAREAMAWVQGMASEAGISLRLQHPLLDGRVRADRRRLGQIAVNLLTNAIKYNRPGGFVEVGTQLRGQNESEQWALVVRDSGRGIDREARQRIFEPFNRLGAELEGIAGTGIGLTIVRQLTERMGGRVELDSQVGVGSEFRVWLPADTEATRPIELDTLPPLLPELPAGRLRLLYIEDNPVNQQLVSELLALRPGVELHCAATARAGIALALSLRPDVILLDMQLPDMHGSQVLAALSGRAVLLRCRFIALSANAMPTDVAAARAAGFDDYWTKPIQVARFLAGIDALLARQ